MIESIRINHSAAGKTSVTVTQQDGEVKVAWTEKCFMSNIDAAVTSARKQADNARLLVQKAGPRA